MEQPTSSVDVITTTIQEHHGTRPLRHKISHRLPPVFWSKPRAMSVDGGGVFTNVIQQPMTLRSIAEIQLQALLNDPEKAMPTFARRTINYTAKDDQLTIEQVSKMLNTQPFIIERLLSILNFSSDGETAKMLSMSDVHKLTRVLTGTISVRALLLFMLLDGSNNYYVTREGLLKFYERYLSKIPTFNEDRTQEVMQALLQKFRLDTKPRIDFEEFYSIVSKDSTLLESLSQFTVHPTWFVSPPPPPVPSAMQRFFNKLCWQQNVYEKHKSKLTMDYLHDNLASIVFCTLYILLSIALTIYVAIYRSTVTKSPVLIVFARIGGMLLNFNCALVIALMLKQTILLIRSNTLLRKLIPVDSHIDFHKVVGRVIVALSIMHTTAHLVNMGLRKDHSWATLMFTTQPDIGWVGGLAPISGVILCLLLATIAIFSMQWIRRGGHFQIFYWTHLLYLPFLVLIIIHATNFWKWIVGPLTVLLLEKLYSVLTRYSSRSGRTYLHSATIEQSNVISLTISRPKNFSFKPGDYISINLPRVALYEFHPFTISSAPEQTDYLRVHIQACGNWTKRVYERFNNMSTGDLSESHIKVFRADLNPDRAAIEERIETENQCRDDGSDVEDDSNSSAMSKQRSNSGTREPVVINGPYSSCARYVFDCKHVVLIGGGIGITPYASILSSIMAHFRASRTVCKHCHNINYHSTGLLETHRLRKVDFIWVNRDQKNFEWFLNLLRQFEEEQETYLASNPSEQPFLGIHLFFTEIKHDENIGNVPLDLVTRIWAQVAKQDIFTSLKSKTHIGRPKWEELFSELISGDNTSTKNDVDVFYCGPATMANIIREECSRFRFRFYKELF